MKKFFVLVFALVFCSMGIIQHFVSVTTTTLEGGGANYTIVNESIEGFLDGINYCTETGGCGYLTDETDPFFSAWNITDEEPYLNDTITNLIDAIPTTTTTLYVETDPHFLDWNFSYDNITDLPDYCVSTGGCGYLSLDNESYFNDTVDNRLTTVFYNATEYGLPDGSVADVLEHIMHRDGNYDGLTFNVTESAGAPGLDIRFNFTNVESFNAGVMRYKTSSLSGDYPVIQLWNYDTGLWEDYPQMPESLTFATISQQVFDTSEHLSDDIVRMRLYKAANGNVNNHFMID